MGMALAGLFAGVGLLSILTGAGLVWAVTGVKEKEAPDFLTKDTPESKRELTGAGV
jgi:hypothetical protein